MACSTCGRDHDSPSCPTSLELLKKALDPRTRPVQMSFDEACATMQPQVFEATAMVDPTLRPPGMTLEEACSALSRDVYMATELFERLESAQLVFGNGHHARQRVAGQAVAWLRNGEATRQRIVEFAIRELRERWKKQEAARSA